MAFEKMNNLKRLIIESGSFTTGPKHLPNSLRVLEWWDYPSPSLPIDFHPKKLVKLELLGSCLMSLDLFMSKKMFVNMRVLNFSDSQNITEIPDLCGVPRLQELSFCNCENLIKIHESVGFLDKLKILYADGCSKLTSFPPIKLTSLEELKLSYCGSLECFPEILGKMENVTSLDIKNTPIKELPSSIQNLTQLQRIKLKNGGIIQLPSSIFGMKELRYFIVKKCEGLLLSKENEGEAQMTSMVFRNPIDFLDLSHSNISDEFLLRGLPLFANVKELHLRGDDFTILPACIKELQLREYEVDVDRSKRRGPEVERIYFVILEMAPVTYIDSSAVQALKDLYQEYKLRDIQIAISNPSPEVLLTLSRSGLVELIGKEWYFVRVHDAVQVCLQHVQSLKGASNSPQAPFSSVENKPSLFARLSKERVEKLSITDLESGNGRPPLPEERDSKLEPLLSKDH
ncbi:Putative sulfate transporter 4.2 [Glycine soja]|uniref:Putative sulfate transporter 4.2 n=1 Tax=Glycine soja TaxID=3848 RepID=A0A0B2SN45_GLYSO|nr:Putative sulfate transporter 4.2 [Glycine soja]